MEPRINTDGHGLKIRNANQKDILESLDIARDLGEWFTGEALKKMESDFEENLFVVGEEKVVGFLSYKISEEAVEILWIGVDRKYLGDGVGTRLLGRLEEVTGEKGIKKIFVNTLSYRDDYAPYLSTRKFYLKNGFVYGEIFRKDGEDEQVKMEKVL